MKALILALLFATTAPAEEPRHVKVVALGTANARPESSLPEIHVVGGKPAKIQVAVDAPLGAKATLTAHLTQVAHSLAAPVGGAVSVAEDIRFDDRTHRIAEVSVPVPEVRRITRFLCRFGARREGGADFRPAGEAWLTVYPPDHLDAFKSMMSTVSLVVFGDSPRLKAFLTSQEIPFRAVAGFDLLSSPAADVLHAGESSAKKLMERVAPLPDIRLVVFDAESDRLPGVYADSRGKGITVKVTLPVLENINIDPQSQQAFASIFFQSLDGIRPSSSMTP